MLLDGGRRNRGVDGPEAAVARVEDEGERGQALGELEVGADLVEDGVAGGDAEAGMADGGREIRVWKCLVDGLAQEADNGVVPLALAVDEGGHVRSFL
jgi:hypothetical protein